MIDQFIKIFGLIQKFEVSLLTFVIDFIQAMENQKKQEILKDRIIVSIKLLLKENPTLPIGFKFKGKCLLTELQKDNF